MFVQTKMKAIELAVIFSMFLLLPVDYALARPDGDVSDKRSLSKNTGAVIEDNILKVLVDPIDVKRKIGQVIFDVLSKKPDHVSQIDAETGKQITYREMKDQSIRLAAWMKKQGIHSNDIIVECSHNHMSSYLPLVATFFVDAIFSAWTTNQRVDTARQLLQQYAPKLIFADENAADTLFEAAKLENFNVKIIVFGKHSSLQSFDEIMSSQMEEDVSNFTLVNEKSPLEATAILLTSGTTSFPKGVVYSSKSLLAMALGYRSVYADTTNLPNENGIVHLWYIDLSWISGLWFALQTIIQKDVRIIATASDEDHYFQIMEKYQVHVAEILVSLIQSISKSKPMQKYNLQSFQFGLISGLKFSREILEGLQQALSGVFIQYAYGTTEAGAAISLRTTKYKDIESVGFVVPNGEVKIVDIESNKNLGPHQRGEICTKTLTMMIGYYNNPDLTEKAFDKEGWYRTGDLGYYDDNGEIFIVGRLKNIIKYKNHTIELPVIQYTLSTHPDVEKVAVISIPHGSDGRLPVAFVKKVPGSKVTEGHLIKLLSVLEKYRDVEIKIHFVNDFPRTGSGKIAERELEKLAQDMVNTV